MARPEIDLDEKKMLEMLQNGYTCRQIASAFGVSASTVSYRMKKYVKIEKEMVVRRKIHFLN